MQAPRANGGVLAEHMRVSAETSREGTGKRGGQGGCEAEGSNVSPPWAHGAAGLGTRGLEHSDLGLNAGYSTSSCEMLGIPFNLANPRFLHL